MSGGGGSKDDAAIVFGLICLVSVALIALIWYFFHQDIINAIRWVRVAEVWLIGLFTDVIMMAPATAGAAAEPAPTSRVLAWLSSRSASNLSLEQLGLISKTVVAQYMLWPSVVIMAVLGGFALYKSPETRFRTKFTLDTLIERQAISWPVIQPIVRFNPANAAQRSPTGAVPAVLPLFSEALSPEEWLAYNRVPIVGVLPDRDVMRQQFVKQLGAPWRGPTHLPDYQRALLAAFALKGARKRDAADAFIGELSLCWDPKKGFRLTGALKNRIRQILADPKQGGEALKIANQHGYVSTALVAVLLWARERGGVLAPATFIWLRAVDRTLWYPLNNAGRRTFHAEAAGVIAHFYSEKSLRRPLPMPKIDAALDAVNEYMVESGASVPPLDNNKKSA